MPDYRQMMNKRRLIDLIRDYPINLEDDESTDAILFQRIDEAGFLIHKAEWYKDRNVRLRNKIKDVSLKGLTFFWKYYKIIATILFTLWLVLSLIFGNENFS